MSEASSGREAEIIPGASTWSRPRPDAWDDPRLFSFDDQFAGLAALGLVKKRALRAARQDVGFMRDFARTHLRPLVLRTDLAIQENPSRLASEMLDLAVRHRLLSRMAPRFLGGESSGVLWSLNPCAEESAAVEPAFQTGVLGGHGLGLAALLFTYNFRALDWVVEKSLAGEASGRPFLIDMAITEPGAGTDVEENELLPHARLMTSAKNASHGAILNGRKCFITGAHLASCHLVAAPFDLRDPAGTMSIFLVPGDSKGFSLGRLENKMGHKAGPAGELIFDDCFVPEENIVLDARAIPSDRRDWLVEMVLGLTRIVVGAVGTGVARGAFEIALSFAKNAGWKGRTIISRQWAQEVLTDMLMEVYKARAVYLEATQVLLTKFIPGETPRLLNNHWAARVYRHRWSRKIRYSRGLRRLLMWKESRRPLAERQRLRFYSSLAKVAGSDAGLENCHRALELMGRVGLRHEAGAEKLFRDAKLIQIFEGTNQLNRLNMFKNFIARDIPGLETF
ncbi:MAG: acyl-CoA dehydrogenase [Pseudomonadota bacterium]